MNCNITTIYSRANNLGSLMLSRTLASKSDIGLCNFSFMSLITYYSKYSIIVRNGYNHGLASALSATPAPAIRLVASPLPNPVPAIKSNLAFQRVGEEPPVEVQVTPPEPGCIKDQLLAGPSIARLGAAIFSVLKGQAKSPIPPLRPLAMPAIRNVPEFFS